jgi:DUF4097 and DUF4098 domain-containing protein YvlB
MHRFNTPNPPRLTVEFRAGTVNVETRDVTETIVELDGSRDAVDATTIEQRGDEIVVLVPRRLGGLFSRSADLRLTVTAPRLTALAIQSGSADITATGDFGTTTVSTGSGDVDLGHVPDSARVRTGSGKVRIGSVDGDLDIQTGSGDIIIGTVAGQITADSGSGDISLRHGGTALRANTGSGDVAVGDAPEEIRAKTGSGDIRIDAVARGEVRARAASGDIHAGVRSGTAAWLDVRTVSGKVRSGLESGGEPAQGEQQVRLELETVSGNIELVRVRS